MARGVKTGGRQKGTPNKVTTTLKEAILVAAENAGDGSIAVYLEKQATKNPGPFMSLLGKVLPTVHGGDPESPIEHKHVIERIITDPRDSEVVEGTAEDKNSEGI